MADVGGSAATANEVTLHGPERGKRPARKVFPSDNHKRMIPCARNSTTDSTPCRKCTGRVATPRVSEAHRRHGRQRRAPRERLGLRRSSVKRARVQDAGAPTQSICLLRQQCMNLSVPMTVRRTAIPVSRLAAPRRSDSLPKILWIDKIGPLCGSPERNLPYWTTD